MPALDSAEEDKRTIVPVPRHRQRSTHTSSKSKMQLSPDAGPSTSTVTPGARKRRQKLITPSSGKCAKYDVIGTDSEGDDEIVIDDTGMVPQLITCCLYSYFLSNINSHTLLFRRLWAGWKCSPSPPTPPSSRAGGEDCGTWIEALDEWALRVWQWRWQNRDGKG